MVIEKIQPFAIALALGLLIGVERERSHPPGIQALGLRTFVLLSLLGAIASATKQPFVAAGMTLFVAAIVVLGYLRSTRGLRKDNGIGITTEVSAFVTYGLGMMSQYDPLTTLLIGLVVVILLLAKKRLHTFSRERLRSEEIQATVIILVLALGVLPFLPNAPVDPWLLFNPQRFGILIFIITLMQFGAYELARFFGAERGVALSGFLNGFISSAVATASFAEQVKKGEISAKAGASAICYATVSMYIKLLIIIALTSFNLVNLISWPIICSTLVGIALSAQLTRNLAATKVPNELDNPIALMSAIRLAIILALMLITITLIGRHFGIEAMQIASFLGGLFDVHSVSFAIATLNREAELTNQMTLICLGLAILASFLSKIIMVIFYARSEKTFVWITSSVLVAMAAVVSAVWAVLLWG